MSFWANLAKDGVKETVVEVVDNMTFTVRLVLYTIILIPIGFVCWKTYDSIVPISQFEKAEIEKKYEVCPKSYILIKQEIWITPSNLDEFNSACGKESRSDTVANLKEKAVSTIGKLKFWKKNDEEEEK
jgi:hypothetical protein